MKLDAKIPQNRILVWHLNILSGEFLNSLMPSIVRAEIT